MRGGHSLNTRRLAAAALAAAAASFTPAQESTSPEGPSGLAEALAGPSGVRVATMCTNCNVASVTMLGQSGEAVQVWQDGLPVMGGLGAIYLLSVLPGEGIGQTEIVRGAGTVLSGSEASAGAVVITTREPKREPFLHAQADVGDLDWSSAKIYGAVRQGRWGGDFAATHARSEGSDPDADGNFDLGAFDRTTVGASGVWEASDRSVLRIGAVRYTEDQRGSKGGYRGAFSPIDYGAFYVEDIDIARAEVSLGWDLELPDASRLTVRGRYTERDQQTADDSGTDRPYMTVDEYARLFEARYERTLWNRHVLTVGGTYRNFDVSGRTIKKSILYPDGQSIDDFIHHQGAYAQVDLALPARLSLTAGLRWDDYGLPSGNGTSRGSPRLRLAWKATPKLSLSASAGDGLTAPRPIFERVCCGATVQSNANVRAEVTRNLLLDADWVHGGWLKLRASAFRTEARDHIQKLVAFSNPNFVPSYQQANRADVLLEGGELSVETRFLQHLTLGAQATHLRSDSRDPLKIYPLPSLPTLSYELPAGRLPYLADDTGTVGLGWDDGERGLRLSAQAQYTGSMDIQELKPVGPADVFVATPSFWTFNVRGEVRLRGGLSAFAGVDNLTDEAQTWLDDPRYEYNWGPLRGRYAYFGLSIDL